MSRSRTPAGLDVGGKFVKAVQMSRDARGWRVGATAAFPRSEVNAPLSAAEVRRFAEVMRRRSFKGAEVVLAVPGDKQITGTMELPARNPGVSLDAAARMEFSRAYKCDANAFEMSYWDLPAPARAARTTNVMAVACAHPDADALIDLFAAEGLDVVGLDTRAWAMARACGPAVEDAGGTALLLEIGWNATLLVVVHRGVVIYERSLADSGLGTLRAELESDLHVAPEVAEFVLGRSGLVPVSGDDPMVGGRVEVPSELREEVRGVTAAHFERVAHELRESISYTTHQYPDAVVSRVLLLGGGAMIPGIAEHVRGLLGFECRVVTPLLNASCSPTAARECNAALSVAAGLAMYEI